MHLENGKIILSKEEHTKIKQKIIGDILTIEVKISEEITRQDIENKMSEIEDFVKEYRLLFKGKKEKAMGDSHACPFKMALFMLVYPQYSQEDIINAARKHIESNKANNYRYMRRADYFIFKQEEFDGRKMITSTLLSVLEDSDTELEISNDYFKDL